MRYDDHPVAAATFWAVETGPERAVAEQVAGVPVPGTDPQEGLLRVMELLEDETRVAAVRVVRALRTLREALDTIGPRPAAERLELLGPLLRVCETLGHAHETGITHGSLHPGGIALIERGQVVLRGWEVATFADGAKPEDMRLEVYLAHFQEAADLRVVAGARDAVAYLSPETLRGEMAGRDATADVYALGAMLYHLLTGCVPYAFQTFAELSSKAQAGKAVRASQLDGGAPAPLSALAARCLSPEPAARPTNAGEVADTIRAWLTAREEAESVRVEREHIGALIRAVREYSGDAAPRCLDEAIARSRKLLNRDPGDRATELLRTEAEQMREAMHQAEREKRERVQAEMERAWADATEARAELVRVEADAEEASAGSASALEKLDAVRNDLTRARAENANLHKQLERHPHDRDRAVAYALEVEQSRRRKLLIVVGVLVGLLAVLAVAMVQLRKRVVEGPSAGARSPRNAVTAGEEPGSPGPPR